MSQYVGTISQLIHNKRGKVGDMEYFADKVKVSAVLPLSEIVSDFYDKLKTVSSGFASFDWDFGDSLGTSTLENPTYTYSETGGYTVTLTITDNGCLFTATNTVSVFEVPQAYFWLKDGVGCDPFSVEFFASSIDPLFSDSQLSYFGNVGVNTD